MSSSIDYYKSNSFSKVEDLLNIDFNDKTILVKAFTHSSFNSLNNQNYQRLEFMGDAILQLCISDFIYKHNETLSEGEMSKMRAKIVNEFSLAYVIRKESLDKFILVGKSVTNDVSEYSDSIVSDIFESLIAAIYLDQGQSEANRFIQEFLIHNIEELLKMEQIKDYKTKLQEELQVNGSITLKYETSKDKDQFISSVFLENIKIGTGFGKSKKLAEQQAAKNAIEIKL